MMWLGKWNVKNRELQSEGDVNTEEKGGGNNNSTDRCLNLTWGLILWTIHLKIPTKPVTLGINREFQWNFPNWLDTVSCKSQRPSNKIPTQGIKSPVLSYWSVFPKTVSKYYKLVCYCHWWFPETTNNPTHYNAYEPQKQPAWPTGYSCVYISWIKCIHNNLIGFENHIARGNHTWHWKSSPLSRASEVIKLGRETKLLFY